MSRRPDRSGRAPAAVRRRPRGERGVASLELLGMIPLALVAAIIAVTVAGFMWTVTSTNEAARHGARAQSLGQDGCSAALQVLSPTLRDDARCTPGGGVLGQGSTLRLEVRPPVPAVVDRFLPNPTVTREVRLP